jgi:hypothetical protein
VEAGKPGTADAGRKSAAYDASLVNNGSFESKDDTGRPRGWIVAPLEIIDRKTAGQAAEGKAWLGLKGVKDSWGVIAANVTPDQRLLGRDLRIVAFGKAPEPNKMRLSLEYAVDGKKSEAVKKYWSKTNDQWEKMELTASVPESADPKSLRLRVLLSEGSKTGYALDGVRVVIDLLGPNAGLEVVDETGRPRGWILSPSEAVASDSELKPAEGGRAIALRAQENSWGLLAHELKVDRVDLGQTIFVAAQGYADKVNNLRVVVRGDVDGKTTDLASEWWPATRGEWKQVALQVPLPSNLDPASVQVRFEVRQGAEGLYGVDQVQAGLQLDGT